MKVKNDHRFVVQNGIQPLRIIVFVLLLVSKGIKLSLCCTLTFIDVSLSMVTLLFPVVTFPPVQSTLNIVSQENNSASLLFLGTHPKLMLCMRLSLSGQLLLTSPLLIQCQPITLQLPCWVMKESLTGNQLVTKVA